MKRLQGLSLAMIGIALFMPHLVALGYHPFAFEVLSISLVAAGTLFAMGLVSHHLVYSFLIGFLVYWFVDSYFLHVQGPYLIILTLFFFIFALGRVSQTIIPILALIYGIGFTAPAFFDFPDPILRASKVSEKPRASDARPDVAFIHIILDEAASPLALPDAVFDADDRTARFEDYQSVGFMMHGLAMSEGRGTLRSLGGVFGRSNAIDNYERPEVASGHSYELKENILVGELVDNGFDVSVIQSNYLELCVEDLVTSCETYTRGANMSAVARNGRTFLDRFTFALAALNDSYLDRNHMVALYQDAASAIRDDGETPVFGFFSRPLVASEILKDLSQRVRVIEPGQALVAHILFPHFPYVLDEACEMKSIGDWAKPLRFNRSADLGAIYEAYVEQDRCAHALMMDMFENLPKRDDLVVIVHGDHGTRIALDTSFESDIDTFGTFLAIKAPNITAGLSAQPVSLQRTFNDYFGTLLLD